MARERLFIIHGMGPDAVGLVGRITEEMAQHKGNILDLRQDVLHGLFIIYLVVDLSDSNLRIEEFSTLIARLSEDTGIMLQVDNYNPVARNPERKNMLVTLLGADHPGIIASIAKLLGNYAVNIEFARNIGREGVFLMELMTDISACTIPLENVMSTVSTAMAQQGIKSLFQTDDVFNKKKRIILFDINASLMDEPQRLEVVRQAGLDQSALDRLLSDTTAQTIAAGLEGISCATYESMFAGIHATPDTLELLQTLKTMGYTIGLISSASTLCIERLSTHLALDYRFGIPYEIDHDTQTFTGAISCDFSGIDRQSIIRSIVAREGITADDVTIINTGNRQQLPGIHPVFDLGAILELYNKRSLAKEFLTAAIASFGFIQA
jgi:phosphoserine phosphatase